MKRVFSRSISRLAWVRKQTLLRLAVLLLAGAIVNVAVTWGCALWIVIDGNYSQVSIIILENQGWTVVQWDEPGATRLMLNRSRVSKPVSPWRDGPLLDEIVPSWTGLNTSNTPDQREFQFIDGRGWPCVTMWCEYHPARNAHGILTDIHVAGGMHSHWKPLTANEFALIPRALPLRPIWPGFAINTGFFATML